MPNVQHTIALLLALLDPSRAATAARNAADATEDLLERRPSWLPHAANIVGETGPVFLLAPDDRLSSAEQGALMFREGPRLQADACETGDWLHVDVYLTKPLDYQALVFAGSRFDGDGSRIAAAGSSRSVRRRGACAIAATTTSTSRC